MTKAFLDDTGLFTDSSHKDKLLLCKFTLSLFCTLYNANFIRIKISSAKIKIIQFFTMFCPRTNIVFLVYISYMIHADNTRNKVHYSDLLN